MIEHIRFITVDNTVPYENLAMEELLLHGVEPGECILYLWQNRNTVVIGRNQNCRSECKLAELEGDGGFLARRLSGGGAVFHDLGNLNFTFLVQSPDYDLDRQLGVIVRGVQSLGVAAEKTGRNDITAAGRKFSGNAFYRTGNRQYHHGTVMIDADLANLSHYLTVAPDKLAAKGIQSVRSRVVNLREFRDDITVERTKAALIEAFGQVYGLTPQPLDGSRLDPARLAQLTEKFASYDWRIGKDPDSTLTLNHRFGWGGVELRLVVEHNRIRRAAVFTDAMNADLAPLAERLLTGAELSAAGIQKALTPTAEQSDELMTMMGQLSGFITEGMGDSFGAF